MKYFSYSTFTLICFITFTFAVILNSPVDSKSVRVHTTNKQKSHYVPKTAKPEKYKNRNRVHTRPTPKAKVAQKNTYAEIKKQDENFQTENSDFIQSSFDSGIRRLVRFLNERFALGLPEEVAENFLEDFKAPVFLPSNFLLSRNFDFTNLLKLLNAPPDSNFEELAEIAVVDGISQLVGIIGFNDLRDWMGLSLTYFILGPILIPLFLLPIACFGMLGLLFPLFLFNPPSKPNVDVMGHDPIVPKSGHGERRSLFDFNSSTSVSNLNGESYSIIRANVTHSPSNFLDSCVERVTCQFARIYRDNPVSQWLARRFNSTKVEWARLLQEFTEYDQNIPSKSMLYIKEDCKKYICPLFPFNF